MQLTNVIAAISTPPGKGGVAVIRLSGEGAFSVIRSVFSPKYGNFDSIRKRVATYGYIKDGNETLDDVILTLFPAPNSYTGEDTAEISCHGGLLLTKTILELLLKNGARAAEAGEFTKRAFISGKLTLTEAEAIGTLLEAESPAQIRLASEDSRTRLGKRLLSIRESLITTLSSVFARIDYPDEDLGDFTDEELLCRIYNIKEDILSLSGTYKTGKAITEGIKTAIVGKPNVGKSSIYNLLCGEDSAIVTDIPGTTRDVLTSSVSLGKVMLRLADTAGIRGDVSDKVEEIGIKKSEKVLSECELLFAIFDISREFDKEDEELLEKIKHSSCKKIAILNKSDKEIKFDYSRLLGMFDKTVKASTKSEEDKLISELCECVESLFLRGEIHIGYDAIISSARQNAALISAIEHLSHAEEALRIGLTQDVASGDLERALGVLGELDGREVSEAVVSDIFSKFCVGK